MFICGFIKSIFLICLALPALAWGQVRLPLEGYYRPGKCMPVFVEASDSQIHLVADRAVPTEISPHRNGIVPMLMLGDADILHADAQRIPLHELAPNERLVGSTSDNARDVAQQLFPKQTIVMIHLDPAQPLPGPMIAWEALDAIISDKKIFDDPRWKRIGAFWVLRAEIHGPGSAIGGDVAYLPVESWEPQQPILLRRQILIMSILVCLLLMSSLLIRSRWSMIVMLGIALMCSGAIEFWRRAQPLLQSDWGKIIVDSDDLQQMDQWQYFTTSHGGFGEMKTPSQPIVMDWNHATSIDLKLQANTDGSDAWQFNLPANAQLAFLTRTFSPKRKLSEIKSTNRSPLYELAREMYLDANSQIIGEIKSDDSWPTVVIGRK
ncbi:MAG TPA: hypothetical protein VKK61_01130 [Tepidisphaeraceae bacterium]|nr:hypothetical protein [Tepidisphaeraceae bacterium]